MKSDLFEDLLPVAKSVPKPTFRHRMLFNFLVISPSYYIAHISRSNKRKAQNAEKVPDFNKVLKMYSLCGNVFDKSFSKWWVETGHKVFAVSPKEPTLLFKPDLTKSAKYNSELLTLLIQSKKHTHINNEDKIELLKNKIRDSTLRNRYVIVTDKYDIDNHEQLVQKNGWLPNWLAAYHFRNCLVQDIKSRAFKDITKNFVMEDRLTTFIKGKSLRKDGGLIKIPINEIAGLKVGYRNKASEKAKRYLSMLMSKNLAEARYISENAARGLFPSKQSIPCLSFDPITLKQVLYRDWDQIYEEMTQLKDRFITPMRQKKKAKDAQKELIAESLREREIRQVIQIESQAKAEEMALEIARDMYQKSFIHKNLRK